MVVQAKSRKRVHEHGEALTNEREVNAVLGVVRQESERIDLRFLAPACGFFKTDVGQMLGFHPVYADDRIRRTVSDQLDVDLSRVE